MLPEDVMSFHQINIELINATRNYIVSIVEADGVEDGPPPHQSGDAGKPIDVTYHCGQDSSMAGLGVKTIEGVLD